MSNLQPDVGIDPVEYMSFNSKESHELPKQIKNPQQGMRSCNNDR